MLCFVDSENNLSKDQDSDRFLWQQVLWVKCFAVGEWKPAWELYCVGL